MKNYRYFYSVFLLILLFVFSSGVAVSAIPVSSQIKLIADDAFKDAGFGWGVAVDGDTAVVSAFADYDNIGAAYVYERTDAGWQQVAKLTASDGEEGDFLGISVTISGDTIALGAALDDNAGGADAGAVYIYVKPASGWTTMNETVKLMASTGSADRGFGGAVSLIGDTLVIGAPGKDDALIAGDVFVYEGAGSSWNQKAVLSVAGLNGSDSFGTILDFDGSTIAVGAFGKDASQGAVYVYHKPAGGWSDKNHDAMLVADDGAANDFFGGSVAVYSDTILVGANGDDDNGSKSGAAYLFVRSGNSWGPQAKISPADGMAADNFGYAVDLAGNTAVIGASHFSDDASDSIYIFTRSGSSWTELGEILDPDSKAGSKFGLSVAIDDSATTVLAGAFGADAGTGRSDKNAGAAYLFELEAPVDLALVKQDDTDPVLVGENVTYSLLVTNNSSNDATGVTVTDTLPAGLSYISDDGGCSQSGQTVSCNLGTIGKNGGTASVAITARADSAGSVTNTATVSANETDANSSDNTDSEVTVVRDNTPPQAVDDAVTTDEDTAVTTGNVLTNDTDADGDTLSVSGADAQSAQGGTVVNNGDGTFTYTPPAGFDGSDSFNYTVSDGNGGEDQGSVQITVNAVNHPPVAVDDSVTTDEDRAVTTGNVLANDIDPDGDTLSVSGADAQSAQGGTVVNNGDGTFTYTPPAGFDGSDSFGYTVSDGNGGEDQGSVQITVNAVNQPPVAVDDSVTTDEDSAVTTGNVLANDTDPDGDTLSVSGADAQSAQGGTVVNNGDGTFTYTPPAGFDGSDSFNYTVSDGNGGEDQGSVQITVNAVNQPPVAVDDSVTTDEDSAVTTGNVLANDTDPDGDTLSVSGADAQSAQGGTVVNNGDGTFTYTPPAGFDGSDSFGYTVSDGNGGEDQGSVQITVNAVNQPPVAVDDSVTTDEGTAVTTGNVLANDTDPDGDTLTVSGADARSAQGGTVVNNGDGTFTYTPPAGFDGSDSFNYTVSDGNGGEDQGSVQITVNAVNHPPVAVDDSVTTDEDSAVTTGNVLANDTDPDGDTLTVSGADARSAQGGTVVNNGDGTFTYTPPTGFSGNDSFRYTVSDGNGGETQGTVQIAVNTVNQAPVAVADSASTTEGSPVTTGNVLANDTDPDGDTLSIIGADSQSAGGGSVVNHGDGTFTYTPPTGFSGADSFNYMVSDGNGAEAQGKVNITVTKVVPVNNPPVAMEDSVTTQQDTPVTTGDVLANDSDPDGDSVTVSGVDSQSAQGGTVVDNGDGTFTYTPAAGYVGSDTFNYMISDGKGGQAQGTVNITVEQATSTNADPVAADDSAETEADTAVTIANVLANDSDADGDALSIASADAQSEQGGSVDNHGDGSFTYTPPAGFSGEDRFHYTISDGNGGEDQGTVTITVNEQDDGDGFWLGAFDLWMLLLLLFPLGYRRYQQSRRC